MFQQTVKFKKLLGHSWGRISLTISSMFFWNNITSHNCKIHWAIFYGLFWGTHVHISEQHPNSNQFSTLKVHHLGTMSTTIGGGGQSKGDWRRWVDYTSNKSNITFAPEKRSLGRRSFLFGFRQVCLLWLMDKHFCTSWHVPHKNRLLLIFIKHIPTVSLQHSALSFARQFILGFS